MSKIVYISGASLLFGDGESIDSEVKYVGTIWQRCTLAVTDVLEHDFRPMIRPLVLGLYVGADAFQIKRGSTPTPYHACPMDERYELPDMVYTPDEVIEPCDTKPPLKALTCL